MVGSGGSATSSCHLLSQVAGEGSLAVPVQGGCAGPQSSRVCMVAGSLGLGVKVMDPSLQVRMPRPGGSAGAPGGCTWSCRWGRAAALEGVGSCCASSSHPHTRAAQRTSARPHPEGVLIATLAEECLSVGFSDL